MPPRSPERSAGSFLAFLRTAALIAAPVGAIGSVALMAYTGRQNPSRLLLALFAGWVVSPFVALAAACIRAKASSAQGRAALYSLMVALTVCSLALYGVIALGPPRQKPAFFFLMVPALSWLLIGVVVAIAARVSRGRASDSRRN